MTRTRLSPTRAMNRRKLLLSGIASGLCLAARDTWAADKWGADVGYPSGWGPAGQLPRWEAYTEYRASNYSGGFEKMFRHLVIQAAGQASPLKSSPAAVSYRWGFGKSAPEDYLQRWPVTSLLIMRDGEIFFEDYRMERTATMRMTSWSMAKSVTSLLFGIAFDQGLIRSLDDLAQSYVPKLEGTLHGSIPLRHLLNMSSGADVVHERDPVRIDVPALLGDIRSRATGTDVERVVRQWTGRLENPGVRFNYNELCPLTIGMVLRQVSGMSLADFAQKHLWQPLGAESQATWLTDARGKEYNCVGFAARTRDWARLGQLVAQNGLMQDRRIVSASWIDACAQWGPQDRQVAWGQVRNDMGYKNFFWHPKRDGSWMMMNGHHGQRVLVDRVTRTVLVQTALSHDGPWQRELFALFEAATQV